MFRLLVREGASFLGRVGESLALGQAINDVLGEQRMNRAWNAYSLTPAWTPAATGGQVLSCPVL